MVAEAIEAVKKADVILALDWVDLGGGLRPAFGHDVPKTKENVGERINLTFREIVSAKTTRP